jgi:hypothetical protein
MARSVEIETKNRERKFERFSTLSKICIAFSFSVVAVMFFEQDLMRILTPFLEPFLLLLLALVFLGLIIASIVHIFTQVKTLHLFAFLPILINVITFLLVSNFFVPLGYLRADVGFLIRENKFNRVVEWINQSIQTGEIELEEGKEKTVELPKQYRGLSDRNRVYVTQENGVISIFFSRGGGMFEFTPGYKYRSDNKTPPKDGDTNCKREIKPHWYDCY